MDATFADTLHRETGALQAQHPQLATGLAKAYEIVAGGRLFVEENGREAMALASDGTTYYHVNGQCSCPASSYRHEVCKHRLALRLYQRVSDALQEDDERWDLTDATAPAPVVAHSEPRLAEHLVLIQGRPFVKFEGLLALAHQRGLVALETTVVSVSIGLAVCQAVARFADGRVFVDVGDATPENVAKHLKPHFMRMAATRASARALRRALAIGHCAVEELGQDIEAAE